MEIQKKTKQQKFRNNGQLSGSKGIIRSTNIQISTNDSISKYKNAYSDVLLTDYELVNESRMDPDSQHKSATESSQGQRSQLILSGPRTRVEGTCIGRKLPKSPNEYAEQNRNTCAAEFPDIINCDMAPSKANQLNPSKIQTKGRPQPLNNASDSSSTLFEASESYDDKEGEKLNRDTLDSWQGPSTTHYEILNRAWIEPPAVIADFNGKSIAMYLDEWTSQNACPLIKSDVKKDAYQMLNPDTMDSHHGSDATTYEKLNKATMEPQTCSSDLDCTSIPMHLEEAVSKNVCLVTGSDDISVNHELHRDAMDSYEGSGINH